MKTVIFFSFSLAWCAASQGAALVIGGFSTARADTASISQGPATEELRSAIVGAFPGSTFLGIDTLTPASLAAVDVLIVGAPTFSSPVSLSSAEQTTLRNFVSGGGGALIYFDNDSYAGVPLSDDSNETFLDPFEIDSTGRVPSVAMASSIAPTHPVMNGPHGTVTSFATNFGGWFENLGPNAVALAQYDPNAEPAIAAIGPGALALGSGGVVFIGDADSLVDSADGGLFGSADNQTLLLNAVSFASVPEASTMTLLVSAFLVCAPVFRNFRARHATHRNQGKTSTR